MCLTCLLHFVQLVLNLISLLYAFLSMSIVEPGHRVEPYCCKCKFSVKLHLLLNKPLKLGLRDSIGISDITTKQCFGPWILQ